MTMCNVKGAHSDESTPNSAVSLSSTEHFKVFQLIVLAHNCRQLFLAKKKPKNNKKGTNKSSNKPTVHYLSNTKQQSDKASI